MCHKIHKNAQHILQGFDDPTFNIGLNQKKSSKFLFFYSLMINDLQQYL